MKSITQFLAKNPLMSAAKGINNKKEQKKSNYSSQNSKNDLNTAKGKGTLTGVGFSLSIDGNVRGNEDLTIDGKVKGSIFIENHNLTIGPNGQVEADLQAKNIFVQGRVKGNVRASEKVFIQDSAQVFGDIIAADISVMDGAHFEGNAKIQKMSPDTASHIEPTEKISESQSLLEDNLIEE